MVVGVAGGIDDRLAIGDVIRPGIVIDGASGSEYRPHPLSEQADPPGEGALHTSDEFIVDPERVAALRARGVIAMDMETAAVAAVYEERGCPWSVVRSISDRSSDGMADEGRLRARQPGRLAQLSGRGASSPGTPGASPSWSGSAVTPSVATNAAARAAAEACRQLVR